VKLATAVFQREQRELCNHVIGLTAKEIQVAMLVWEGQTNREIANVIGTTEQVIKNYLRNTFDKLGVWSRLELALYVAAHGGTHWRDPTTLTSASVSSALPIARPLEQQARQTSSQSDKDDHRSQPSAFAVKVSPRLISA
jgi:DNA-binding CsgD family transcriptional regulator